MVEVHLMRFEAAAAIDARNVSELAEEGGVRCLTASDPRDFVTPVGCVVRGVVGALISPQGHRQV